MLLIILVGVTAILGFGDILSSGAEIAAITFWVLLGLLIISVTYRLFIERE